MEETQPIQSIIKYLFKIQCHYMVMNFSYAYQPTPANQLEVVNPPSYPTQPHHFSNNNNSGGGIAGNHESSAFASTETR
jgi:hypothetical protein